MTQMQDSHSQPPKTGILLVAYGSAWMIAGAMGRRSWMKGVGLFAYAGAVLLGAVSHLTVGYLVFAGLLMVVTLIPGVVLTRQEPSEIV